MKYSNFTLTHKVKAPQYSITKFKAKVLETSWFSSSKVREVYSEGGDRWVFTDTGKEAYMKEAILMYKSQTMLDLYQIEVPEESV